MLLTIELILLSHLVTQCIAVCIDSTLFGNIDACQSSLTYRILCNNGGSGQCLCSEGCVGFRLPTQGTSICVFNTTSTPNITIQYPCQKVDTTDVNCNYYSDGTYCPVYCTYNGHTCLRNSTDALCRPYIDWSCPINCKYDRSTNTCIPIFINSDAICSPYIDWSCPYNCKYDRSTNTCIPMFIDSVCSLIQRTLTCPVGCQHNNFLNRCISENPNYLCELEKKLICPFGCILNIRGDTCISMDKMDAICNKSLTPACPYGCTYDPNNHICIRNDNWRRSPCEPIISIACPYQQYTINTNTLVNCYDINYNNDICFDGWTIQYPLRLKNRYEHIMCKYTLGNQCKIIQRICCN